MKLICKNSGGRLSQGSDEPVEKYCSLLLQFVNTKLIILLLLYFSGETLRSISWTIVDEDGVALEVSTDLN